MVYANVLLDLLELFAITEHVIPKIPPPVMDMEIVLLKTQLMHILANVLLHTLPETVVKFINYLLLVLPPIPTEMLYTLVILSVTVTSTLMIPDVVHAVPILPILLIILAIVN
jgi:hypothetical protein